MLSLERLLGLYLAIAVVTLLVASSQLYSRGRKFACIAIAFVPAAFFGLWRVANLLPEFDRDHLALGFLPCFPAVLLVPLAWLCSIAPSLPEPGLADSLLALAPGLLALAANARAFLGVLCGAGLVWFFCGLFAFQGANHLAARGDGTLEYGRFALWLSSAIGLWPLLLLTAMYALAIVARPTNSGRPCA